VNIIPERIQHYLEDLHHVADPVLEEMESIAGERDFPIVGRLVGRVLELSSRLVQARRVLELGSGFGYSAYWIARGMPEGGKLTLTDRSPDNVARARDFLSRKDYPVEFEFREEDAIDVLLESDEELDLVFCDIDKTSYPRVLDPVAKRLRTGGLLLVDNTLWSGRVVEKEPDDATQAIQVFNRLLLRDARFCATILPIRDGVNLAVRLPD
jgi:predicted O-methyltransferase YrrM